MAKQSKGRPGRSRRGRARGRNENVVSFRGTLIDINFAPVAVNHQQVVPTRFPWLTDLALKYSEYSLRSLSFRWVPAGSANDAGQVVGGFTYDSYENIPTTYAQVSQLAQHRLNPIHRGATWRLPTNKLPKRWWPVLSEQDLGALPVAQRAPYLPAIFHLGIRSDRQNGQLAGSIEVIYTVAFTQPNFIGAQTGPTPTDAELRALLDVPAGSTLPPPESGDQSDSEGEEED